MNREILLATALLLLGQSAIGQTLANRFVSTSGFDTNNFCISQTQPCRTIQRAINVANSGDTVVIFDGVYTESIAILAKSLAFTRHSSANRPVVQATPQPGTVNARTVSIIGPASGSITVSFFGLLIRHGNASGSGNLGNGGGILCIQNCILDMQNMFIRSNVAEGEGGGIFIDDSSGESILGNVVIEDNEATNGGGLRTISSDVRVSGNTRIHRNSADNVGGGLYLTAGSATFDGVTIGGELTTSGNGNTADNGGGMYLAGTTATYTDVLIRDNSAQFNGGGIHALSSNLSFTDTLFQVNRAVSSGGGLYMLGTSSLEAVDSVNFTNNQANEDGGGMYIDGGSAELNDVVFFLNSATETGGGLYNSNNADRMVLENVRFRFNLVSCGGITVCSGGGMHVQGSSPVMANVIFEQNRAEAINSAARGAGLSISTGNPTLVNVIFFSNVIAESSNVGRGGAMYAVGNSFPTLVNVAMTGNAVNAQVSGAGGGIAVDQPASPLLVNAIMWGNTAAHNGNEIWLNPDTSIDLVYSLYRNGQGDIAGTGEFEFNPDDDSFTADPLFVDAGNGDLRLQPASPAVDKGVPNFSPILFPGGPDNPVDLDDNPRFDGVRIDLGAYELQRVDNIFDDRFEQ